MAIKQRRVQARRFSLVAAVTALGTILLVGQPACAILDTPTGSAMGTKQAAKLSSGSSDELSLPQVPFCRAGADVGNMWLPVWDDDTQKMEKAKRVVVFGGKG